MISLKPQSGFSLIELMVYVAIVSIVVTGFISFGIDLSASAQKAKVQLELQQNARFALERMLQEIRTAENINIGSSSFGVHPGVLSLSKTNASIDPTVFELSNGILQITHGVGSARALTPDTLEVTELLFEDLSVSGRVQVIRVNLKLRHINADQGEIYNTDASLTGTATIRLTEDSL